MENDSIRASGSDTLVDIWINGKLRAICVTREAIDTYLGFERASAMSDDERCEFVRTHLPLVVSAARTTLRDGNPAADSIAVDGEQLGGPGSGRAGDRRRTERRKTERRKATKPKEALPHGERRRGDRRKTDRRNPKKPN
jgi:hypothetical protein